MRSLLFVPGNSAKMMAKAAASGADVLIFDLEDAVHPDSKSAARQLVTAALASSAGGAPARYVRVNALDSAWCAGDLEAVLPARPDGIMLPKLVGPEDLQRLADLIERWELPAQRDLTKIIPVCTETPAATLSLAARSWAHPVMGRRGFVRGSRSDNQPRRGRPIYGAVRARPQPLPVRRSRRGSCADRRCIHRFSG